MTGGVALNKGMVRALERNLGFKINTSEYCQLNDTGTFCIPKG